jgi:preprotein translocase subunit SecD
MRWRAITAIALLLIVCAGCMGSDEPATTEYKFPVRGGAEEAAKVLESRLDGVDGASARAESSTQVVVELPKKEAQSLLPVVTQPGRLELYDLQGNLLRPSIDLQGFPVPTTSRSGLEPVPEGAIVLNCGVEQRYCVGVNEVEPTRTYYYLFRHTPELTGADFDRERTRQDFDTNTGEPIVILEFNETGAKKFHEITRKLAQRGRSFMNRTNVSDELAFQQFAIVVDGVIIAAPTIDFNENPDGIPGDNGAQITGIGSLEEVRALAAVLRGGELPVRLTVSRHL